MADRRLPGFWRENRLLSFFLAFLVLMTISRPCGDCEGAARQRRQRARKGRFCAGLGQGVYTGATRFFAGGRSEDLMDLCRVEKGSFFGGSAKAARRMFARDGGAAGMSKRRIGRTDRP